MYIYVCMFVEYTNFLSLRVNFCDFRLNVCKFCVNLRVNFCDFRLNVSFMIYRFKHPT